MGFEGLTLTLDECIRVNNALIKAVKSSDNGALKDLIASLTTSDVKGKLKVRVALQPTAPILCALCKRSCATVRYNRCTGFTAVPTVAGLALQQQRQHILAV